MKKNKLKTIQLFEMPVLEQKVTNEKEFSEVYTKIRQKQAYETVRLR